MNPVYPRKKTIISCSIICVLSACFMIIASETSFSDQTDVRLNRLFKDLKASSADIHAQSVEREIWKIWTIHKNRHITALMSQGLKALDNNSLEKGLAFFNDIIEIDPNFAEAWNKRATVYFLMGNFDKSMQDIRRTLILEPRHFGAISGLGLIFNALEQPENALSAYRRVLEIYPLSRSAAGFIKKLSKRVPGLRL